MFVLSLTEKYDSPLRVARGWRRLGIRALNEGLRIFHNHEEGSSRGLLREFLRTFV